MTMTAPQPETAIQVPLEELLDSPYQRERVSKRGNLDELAASMREVGVLEPLIARPTYRDDGSAAYELVAGHRRRRAAKLAGLSHAPVLVRVYTDDQVLEIQVVENSQRADLNPLDEADLYAELIKRGRTVAAIADKVGRSPAYIAQRMQLGQLCKDGRAALDEDKITLGAALVLARLPNKLQQEALHEVLGWHNYGDDPHAAASARSVRELIEEHYMLQLQRAPFPIDDATLRPKAGACTICSKRTGNQAELFADVASKDLCTEPRCFREKIRLYWPIRAKQARDAGQAVLDGKAGKEAAAAPYSKGFDRLDDKVWTGSKHVEARKIVEQAKVPITVAFDEQEGRIVELVKRTDLDKAVRKASPKDKDTSSHRYDQKAAQAKREREERIRRRAVELALTAAVETAEKHAAAGPTTHKVADCVDALVRGFIVRAWSDTLSLILKRRGVEVTKPKNRTHQTSNESAVLELYDGMTRPQRIGLGVELGLLALAPSNWGAKHPQWASSCKALGVDVGKLEQQAKDEKKQRAKAKRDKAKSKAGKGAKAKSSKAPKAQPGVCTGCGCTDSTPCNTDHGPCCWVDKTETLCSGCAP